MEGQRQIKKTQKKRTPGFRKSVVMKEKAVRPRSGTIRLNVPDLSPASQDSIVNGFEEGFLKGHYAGGNAIVDSLLPEDRILPDIPLEDIIAEGIDRLWSRMIPLLSATELGNRLQSALETGTAMSFVRLGEAELLTLAQDKAMTIDEVLAEAKHLSHAGVTLPDLEARDMLYQSLERASVVGIPRKRAKHLLPLAFAVLRAYHLDYRRLQLTDSHVNYSLHKTGFLSRLMKRRRVLLVGNRAADLAPVMKKVGIKVAAAVSPVNGVQDVTRIMEEVKRHKFDLALVSAGIAAVVICERIAGECGKVAVDVGHLVDTLANREAVLG